MSAYSDFEDSLGATSAWPLNDAASPFVDRIGGINLSTSAGSVVAQNSTLILGVPTVSINGTISGTQALSSATAFTLVAWVKIAANQSSALVPYIGNTGSDGYGNFISAHHSGSAGAEFQGLLGGVGFVDSAPTTLSFATTYMLAIRRTGGTTDVFVNGVLVGAGSAATPAGPSNSTAISLVGDCGFVSAYPSGLSNANITALYDAATKILIEPLPVTWSGQTFYQPTLMSSLPIVWGGRSFSLPEIPPLFPTTGRHAFGANRVTRVVWSGDMDMVGSTGLNSFTLTSGTAYSITATVYLDGVPGIPETVGPLGNVQLGLYLDAQTSYAVIADTLNASTGVCTFTLPASFFGSPIAPNVYSTRLLCSYNDGDDYLRVPTYSTTVTVLEP